MGHSVKRKEDPRFIRGAGEYIDDVNLPGQLWLDIVRSPYAHATIKSIDATEALKVPGVAGGRSPARTSEGYKLHWMPTLAGDMQMVLPTDTVMYQAQEVAAVIATSPLRRRRRRRRGPRRLRAAAGHRRPAQGARGRRARPPPRPRRRTSRTTTSGTGNRATGRPPTRPSPPPRSRSREDIYIPRIHVASIETCGCVADWDPIRQQLTLHMTSQAPHAIRTVLALVAAAPACRSPSRTSGSRPTTSAAGSAARCRSTRATCSPSRPRS